MVNQWGHVSGKRAQIKHATCIRGIRARDPIQGSCTMFHDWCTATLDMGINT